MLNPLEGHFETFGGHKWPTGCVLDAPAILSERSRVAYLASLTAYGSSVSVYGSDTMLVQMFW